MSKKIRGIADGQGPGGSKRFWKNIPLTSPARFCKLSHPETAGHFFSEVIDETAQSEFRPFNMRLDQGTREVLPS